MLTADKKTQSALLTLAEIDLQLARLGSAMDKLEANQTVANTRSELLAISDDLLSGHSKVASLEQQLAKNLDDVSLVNQRIIHDETRAKELTNERDIKAIEHELDSLRLRLETLETAELELMDLIDEAKTQVERLTQKRIAKNLELEQLIQTDAAESLELATSRDRLLQERGQIVAGLDVELAAAYERKAARGVAVAELLGRDCTACRLAVDGVTYDSMMSEPEEKLPTCPNCGAFLVR